MMKVGLGLAVVAIVLALAAMGLGLRGTPVGHASTLQFTEFYQGGGARGLILSDKLVALHGQRVVMAGFMAPPLKPALDFFVNSLDGLQRDSMGDPIFLFKPTGIN